MLVHYGLLVVTLTPLRFTKIINFSNSLKYLRHEKEKIVLDPLSCGYLEGK